MFVTLFPVWEGQFLQSKFATKRSGVCFPPPVFTHRNRSFSGAPRRSPTGCFLQTKICLFSGDSRIVRTEYHKTYCRAVACCRRKFRSLSPFFQKPKNFFTFFQKGLDKAFTLCYNTFVIQRQQVPVKAKSFPAEEMN